MGVLPHRPFPWLRHKGRGANPILVWGRQTPVSQLPMTCRMGLRMCCADLGTDYDIYTEFQVPRTKDWRARGVRGEAPSAALSASARTTPQLRDGAEGLWRFV